VLESLTKSLHDVPLYQSVGRYSGTDMQLNIPIWAVKPHRVKMGHDPVLCGALYLAVQGG